MRAAARAARRDRVGVIHGHQHVGHAADRARLPRARPATGALPGDFPLRGHAEHCSRWPTSCAALPRPRPGRPCVVSTACSSSAKVFARRGAHDAAGHGRCGGRGRRRFAVPDDAVRLQFARAAVARAPAGRSMPSARHLHRRGARASRCSSADGAAGRRACSPAAAKRAMRITCRRRIPRASARGWRCEVRSTRAGLHAGRHRLHQPARHGDARPTMRPKARRSPRCSARATPAARPRAATGHTLGAAGITEARDRAAGAARRVRARQR